MAAHFFAGGTGQEYHRLMQVIVAIGVAVAILTLIVFAKVRAKKKRRPTCCQ